ncbi:MAG: aldehyde dehydrogenase family protein [Phycisphaerales bacterium]|nr:aldehyde dehydrogenase family protein [Phycisphaerales bacterium]
MPQRIDVAKTWKLYIGGKFVRSESGQSFPVEHRRHGTTVHLCRASRKDLRDSVEAATSARSGWASASGYLRGQILYRMAEMLECRRTEMGEALGAGSNQTPKQRLEEVDASIDRLVGFAGWSDKIEQILGGQNPVPGPYYNITVPEPTGVVGIVPPDKPALLAAVSMLAAPLCAGNTTILLAPEQHPLPTTLLGEIIATSDVPAGVVNILTGTRDDLLGHMADHRAVNAISAVNLAEETLTDLRKRAAESIKRIHHERVTAPAWKKHEDRCSPWKVEPFLEMKTLWHPSAC